MRKITELRGNLVGQIHAEKGNSRATVMIKTPMKRLNAIRSGSCNFENKKEQKQKEQRIESLPYYKLRQPKQMLPKPHQDML